MASLHKDFLQQNAKSYTGYASKYTNFDEYKIHMIQYEFFVNFCINMLNVFHYLLLLIIKGMNLNLISHVGIGKTLIQSIGKMYSDFKKYF